MAQTCYEMLMTLRNHLQSYGFHYDADRCLHLITLLNNPEIPPDYSLCYYQRCSRIHSPVNKTVNNLLDSIERTELMRVSFARDFFSYLRQTYHYRTFVQMVEDIFA